MRHKKIYIFTNNLKKLLKCSTNLRNRNFEEIIFNYNKHSFFALDLMRNFDTFIIGSSTFIMGSIFGKKTKKNISYKQNTQTFTNKEMKLIFKKIINLLHIAKFLCF